jgi:hypothetical protein
MSGPVAEFCKQCNELMDIIKGGTFLGHLKDQSVPSEEELCCMQLLNHDLKTNSVKTYFIR